MSTVFAKIQLRRGTAAEWAAANPILDEGELGFEIDTGINKVGDGLTAYADLPAYATYDQMIAAQQAIEDGTAQLATFGTQLAAAQNAATTSVAKASEAFVSAGNAKTSEEAAEVSASQSAQNRIDADASATQAATSRDQAAASEQAAAGHEAAALASQQAAAGHETNAAASAVVASDAAAVVGPLADEIQVISDNIGIVEDAAGPLTAIEATLLEMAIAYTNSQTRYVEAVAFS
jgi:hypothetical protein